MATVTKGSNHGRVGERKMLRVRESVLIRGLTPAEAARKHGVSEHTANFAAMAELPTQRCPGCGGKVVMPCAKCHFDAEKAAGRIAVGGEA